MRIERISNPCFCTFHQNTLYASVCAQSVQSTVHTHTIRLPYNTVKWSAWLLCARCTLASVRIAAGWMADWWQRTRVHNGLKSDSRELWSASKLIYCWHGVNKPKKPDNTKRGKVSGAQTDTFTRALKTQSNTTETPNESPDPLNTRNHARWHNSAERKEQ